MRNFCAARYLPPAERPQNIATIAGIPVITRLVNANESYRLNERDTNRRMIPLSMPRILWLERPEITHDR
jgi:hypothetical protein